MATVARPMTIAEYRKLPEPKDGACYELHRGELVRLTRPKHRHVYLQHRLLELLRPCAGSRGVVMAELPFRAVPEHDIRAADVAFISAARWAAIDPEDNLHGSPELVIEIESPSNTAAELEDKETLCMQNGCLEFWVVYPKLQRVRVSTKDGVRRYGLRDSIPVGVSPGFSLAVLDIFQ